MYWFSVSACHIALSYVALYRCRTLYHQYVLYYAFSTFRCNMSYVKIELGKIGKATDATLYKKDFDKIK